ncbi:energy transducer TonB [Glaciimonas sp. CA11.2]|nr:energy transducer TonB [Glaciimonas sp. CA11.2]
MTMPFLFRFRNAAASLPAIFLLVILVVTGLQKAISIAPHQDDTLVKITLMEPAAVLVPNLPSPPPPKSAPPMKASVVQPPPQNRPILQAAAPTSIAEVSPSHVPGNPTATQVAVPVPTPAPVTPALTPAPTPKPSVDISLEKNYYAKLKADVERQKTYPHSREATMEQPQGKVVVWLEVNRNGEVNGSGIDTPASSMLLNRAAESSLRRLKQVEKFPSDAFRGIDQKRFIVTFFYSTDTHREPNDLQGETHE